MTTHQILPLSLTALALILIGTSLPGTYENGTQQASVALAQTTVTPTFATDSITVQEGQTARVTITLPQPVTKTTRVQFTVTPGTARTGTDYIRPSTQTVVFYPNGLTSKTISIRTRTDRTQESNETFSVNLTRVDGKALAEPQRAVVTIADRSSTTGGGATASSDTTAPVKDGAETRPVTGTGALTQQTTTTTQPRCTPQPALAAFIPSGGLGGSNLDYLNGKTYFIKTYNSNDVTLKLPVNWHEPLLRAEQANPQPGRTIRGLFDLRWPIYQHGGMYPIGIYNGMPEAEYRALLSGTPLYDLSISRCKGDFNPQTACVFSNLQSGSETLYVEPTTDSSKDLTPTDPNPGDGSPSMTCRLYGGGDGYYVNLRMNRCFAAIGCTNAGEDRGLRVNYARPLEIAVTGSARD